MGIFRKALSIGRRLLTMNELGDFSTGDKVMVKLPEYKEKPEKGWDSWNERGFKEGDYGEVIKVNKKTDAITVKSDKWRRKYYFKPDELVLVDKIKKGVSTVEINWEHSKEEGFLKGFKEGDYVKLNGELCRIVDNREYYTHLYSLERNEITKIIKEVKAQKVKKV